MSDIWQRQAQFYQRQLSKERYCSFCGLPILILADDEDTKLEWQQKAHMKCVQAFYNEKMKEQQNGT